MTPKILLEDQEGSVMVLTLVMLVVLTLLGISSINNSNVELMIASNDRMQRENFYEAEAAAYIAGQMVEAADSQELLDPNLVNWLSTRPAMNAAGFEVKDNDDWKFTGADQNAFHIEGTDGRMDLLVVREDVAQGSSMDMNSPEIKIEFTIYGRYLADAAGTERANPGRSIIGMGYLKKVSMN